MLSLGQPEALCSHKHGSSQQPVLLLEHLEHIISGSAASTAPWEPFLVSRSFNEPRSSASISQAPAAFLFSLLSFSVGSQGSAMVWFLYTEKNLIREQRGNPFQQPQ